jgi:glycosyltransferase involved in cell wall biosynthesis
MNHPTIGVFSKQLDNWTSGSGHHLHEMMKHILELNTKLRFVFIHYETSDNPIYKQVDEEILIPRNPLRAAAILRRHHFDVLHFTPLTVFAPIWATSGKKTATIHGVEQLLVPQFYGHAEMLHERVLVPYYARKMDHIITVSQTSKNYFVEHFRVHPERVSVCYNAVNSAYRLLPEDGRLLPERLLLKPGEPFIFHLSRFSERKNPWTLLRAFAEFIKKQVDTRIKLVIGGGRWENDRVRAELQRLNIENRVVLAGFVTEEEAVQLYNSAKLFVFPSLAEGFGMPNIEAMACGCPVITSPIFAIPEIVGDAALVMKDPQDFHELANLFEQLVSDTTQRRELIRRGLQHAESFKSWVPSARKMLDVWEKLAGVTE